MNWHSIIFSGKMVRAIIAEKKSQTRRVLKKQPKFVVDGKAPYTWEVSGGDFSKSKNLKCPYGKPGTMEGNRNEVSSSMLSRCMSSSWPSARVSSL